MAVTVTEEQVLQALQHVTYYVHRLTTIACVDLENGFTVVGTSACVDPAQFNDQIGRDLALNDAKAKVWELLGFALASQRAAPPEDWDGMLVTPPELSDG